MSDRSLYFIPMIKTERDKQKETQDRIMAFENTNLQVNFT